MLASRARRDDPEYAQAAAAQLHFLLEEVPRAPSGAISTRIDQVQLVRSLARSDMTITDD